MDEGKNDCKSNEMQVTPLSKDPNGIPGRMVKARLDNGLSLMQLSERSGVKPINLAAIENNRWSGYSLHDLDRARRALGLSLAYVMDGGEEA
jgi:transcriptional regulator with XRE-family HTH domain